MRPFNTLALNPTYPMNIPHHPQVTALLLAGGLARRMGGKDKGLLPFQGRPLVEHVLEAITPQAGAILINANRNRERYRAYGHPVIHDEPVDYQGPLAGFAAGLKHCRTHWLATLPCDGPFVPPDLLFRLWCAREDHNTEIAVAHDGERLQPVHALLHKDLLESLRTFLESGERKVDRWYAQHKIAPADFSDRKTGFTNINTPEALAALESTPAIP